jgi:hypothetical protein
MEKKMKYYAGIGSRKTPPNILKEMKLLASQLEERGWWLRSGGAGGADESFADGVEEKAEIWLPWEGFVKTPNPLHTYRIISSDDEESFQSISKYHPRPKSLSKSGESLMARNYRQVIGNPNSDFIICWTPNGEICGGTGQALRIAKDKKIPIFNMFFDSREDILNKISLF